MKNTQKKNKNLEMIIKILNNLGIKATKENLTLSHVKAYIQAKFRKVVLSKEFQAILKKHNIDDYLLLPTYKKEQIVWRISILENHEQGALCLRNDECPCFCKTSEVILADAPCDQHCFPEMMNNNEWSLYKYRNGIQIDLLRQKVIKYVK